MKKLKKAIFVEYPKQFKLLLITSFISGFCCSFGWPVLHQVVYANISPRILPLETLLYCVAGIFQAKIYDSKKKVMIKWYKTAEILESILCIILTLYLTFKFSPMGYMFLTLLLDGIVAGLFAKCTMAFYNYALHNANDRISYQNASQYLGSVSCILGCIIAMVYVPSIKVALWAFCISDLLRTYANLKTYCHDLKNEIKEQMEIEDRKENLKLCV